MALSRMKVKKVSPRRVKSIEHTVTSFSSTKRNHTTDNIRTTLLAGLKLEIEDTVEMCCLINISS